MPKLWRIIIVSLISVAFAAVWLTTYQTLSKLIWTSPFVTTNHWALPALVLLFSLIVGLAQKYLHAPNVINGGAMDAFKGGAKKSKKVSFLGALITSFASMFSGASIGPEGALGELVQNLTRTPALKPIALASAFNAIVGSPLFTGVLATELNTTKKPLVQTLVPNLLAGTIGYLFFTMLYLPVFAKYIPFTPISQLTPLYIIFAIALGLVGTLLAALTAVLFKSVQTFNSRLFKDRVLERTLFAGAVVALVGFFVPEVMFAGETQIFPMLQNPAAYGFLLLLVLAFLKLFLLAVSFKGGFLGGPTFPLLFAATMLGLALSLIFPAIPVSIFVLCIEVSAIALILNAPLTAILLVAIVGTADAYTICLLVISSVTSMVAGEALKERLSRR